MKRLKIIIIIAMAALSPIVTFHSCNEDTLDNILDILSQIASQTGWLQEQEKPQDIPEDITPLDPDGEQGGGELKSSVDLSSKFPPVGDQGKYGTCVAWATAYNLKTALNAIEKGWSTSELANKANQTSPQDLWLALGEGNRGSGCNGTNFEPALDAMIANNIGSLSDVPYTSKVDCSGSSTGKGTNNKLANYRKIADNTAKGSLADQGLTPENFKSYLSAGRPIAFGARLGDRFMTWKGSSVLSSDTYVNPGMQHAYHALALVGYDDSRNAFRVRNSWNTSWGDNGSIWVDYDFFCSQFCFVAFVAQNVNSVSVGSGGIDPGEQSKGYDLLAFSAIDYDTAYVDPDDGTKYNRGFFYEVYNAGNKIITPAQDWTVTYMLYKTTDAKDDYNIIFEDYYTAKYGDGDGEYNGKVPNTDFLSGGGWFNNCVVEPGQRAGEELFGPELADIYYNMPNNINGKYYLVVMADTYNKIDEVNEDNNFYFISAEGGKPLEFVNGKITNMPSTKTRATAKRPAPAPYSNTEHQTLVKPGNLNAYTPAELKARLLYDKKTGRLAAKRSAYQLSVPMAKKVARKAIVE